MKVPSWFQLFTHQELSKRRRGWHDSNSNHGNNWHQSSAMNSDGLSEHNPEGDATSQMCSTPNYDESNYLGTKLKVAKSDRSFQIPHAYNCDKYGRKVGKDNKTFNLSYVENAPGGSCRVRGDIADTPTCKQSPARELSPEQTQSELEMTLAMTEDYPSASETESKQQNMRTGQFPTQSIASENLHPQTTYSSFRDQKNEDMNSTYDQNILGERMHSSFDLSGCTFSQQRRKAGLKTRDYNPVNDTSTVKVSRIQSDPLLGLTQAVGKPVHRSASTKSWAGSGSAQVLYVHNLHYTQLSTEKLNVQSTEHELFQTKRFPEVFLEPLKPLDLDDWKLLASYLKMDSYINGMEAEVKNHRQSPIRLLMDKWWQVEGSKADVSLIKQALEKMGRRDILDNLEDVEKDNADE